MPKPRSKPTADEKRAEIVKLVEGQELSDGPAWSDLDALSTHTSLDGIEVDPEGIIFEGEKFKGVMNVHVSLQYGGKNDDGFTTSDSFLGEFEGHFDSGKPKIDNLSVDTSSFYE